MKFNFNINRIRFPVPPGQRSLSRIAVIYITQGSGASNGSADVAPVLNVAPASCRLSRASALSLPKRRLALAAPYSQWLNASNDVVTVPVHLRVFSESPGPCPVPESFSLPSEIPANARISCSPAASPDASNAASHETKCIRPHSAAHVDGQKRG